MFTIEKYRNRRWESCLQAACRWPNEIECLWSGDIQGEEGEQNPVVEVRQFADAAHQIKEAVRREGSVNCKHSITFFVYIYHILSSVSPV